jgi:hypothetical protein
MQTYQETDTGILISLDEVAVFYPILHFKMFGIFTEYLRLHIGYSNHMGQLLVI